MADHEVTVASNWVYRGKVVTLRIDQVALADGSVTVREIVEHPGAIVVVPVEADGSVLLVRQFRKAIEAHLLELPAGGKHPDEEPLVCAQRELSEEVGVVAARWTGLGGFYSAPGFCSEYLHLFLAEELSPGALPGDADEEIEVVRLSLAEAVTAIETGEIRDAKSVAGLLRYAMLRR